MDGTLHTDLWESETSREIKKSFEHHLNIIFEHIQKFYWLAKLRWCGSKIKPAKPILGLEYK